MRSALKRLAGILSLVSLAAIGACANDGRSELNVDRTTIGDTLVVHIRSGSVWDTTATLVEELRVGKLDGPSEEMFGQISDLAPDGHGGVYVFDGQVPALRHFDSTGQYLATLGGKGSGPGEYEDASLGLDVRPDGRVLMRDPRNGRINIYLADKPSTHIPVTSGLFTSNSMVIDTAGEMYLKALLGRIEPNKPWPIGLLHLRSDGTLIDSIRPPVLAGEPEIEPGSFGVRKVWEPSPLGYIVAGITAPYQFELRKPDGTTIRIVKDYTPVSIGDDEHAEYEAGNAWTRKYQGKFLSAEIPPVPTKKPAYRGFSIGQDGQIWVQRYTNAVKKPAEEAPPPDADHRPAQTWREPKLYDVFEPDGTYLGDVRLPEGVSLLAHRGSEVWGLGSGDAGELHVIRYRLVTSSR